MQPDNVRLAQRVAPVVMVPILWLSAGGAFGEPSSHPSVAVGSRIRLVTAAVDGPRVEGTVVDIGAEALTLTTDSQQRMVVPRNAIGRLDVSTGRHRHTIRGILIGAAVGAASSVALPKCVNEGCASGGTFDPTFAGLYAFGGAMWGGLIGAAIKTEGWSSVPLDSVRIELAPTPNRGIALGVSVNLVRSASRRTGR